MDWTHWIALLFGGGGAGGALGVWYKYKLDRAAQASQSTHNHQQFLQEQNRDIILELKREIEDYRGRIAMVEEAHDLLRKELTEEYAKDIRMQAEVNRLQQEVGRLKGTPV